MANYVVNAADPTGDTTYRDIEKILMTLRRVSYTSYNYVSRPVWLFIGKSEVRHRPVSCKPGRNDMLGIMQTWKAVYQ